FLVFLILRLTLAHLFTYTTLFRSHFAKSALGRYTQHHFIALVEKHGIAFHEKTLGQLFCDDSAKDIIAMLLNEMAQAGCEVRLRDRKSTRLNSSHVKISYAVFCFK